MGEYKKNNIGFFNPQVENWDPKNANEEAWHLKHDEIILFPVTGETYGTGSLAEVGFSLRVAMEINRNRHVITFVEQELADNLDNAVAREESLRARKLLRAHLANVAMKNVLVVEDLNNMLVASLELYDITQRTQNLFERYDTRN